MTDQDGGGPDVIVTDIGDYVDKNCCERNLKLRLMIRKDRGVIGRMFPYYGTIRSPLDPVLATSGHAREAETEGGLSQRMRCLNPSDGGEDEMQWSSLLSFLRSVGEGEECFAREVEIDRTIGGFRVSGRMDFVILTWRDGRPVLRIVECKASRKDKTYHRIQLAAYRLMVGEELSEVPPVIAGKVREDMILEAAVVRIDPDSRRVQDALAQPTLELREEMDDIRRLLAPGGPVGSIDATPLDGLSYRLEEKCDSCVHDTICMPDSERRARLELLGLDPVTVRALREHGVPDLMALSDLDLASPEAAAIRNTPAFAADLDDLIKRAKARRSALPDRQEGDYSVMSLDHHGVSLLPLHENDAGFRTVRVYLTVEHDHVEDRLVGLCAHVTDSGDEIVTTREEDGTPVPFPTERAEDGTERPIQAAYVIRMMEREWSGDAEQDVRAEGEMVSSFFDGLGKAIAATAGGDEFRPVHFYVWSSREMTNLIESCSRAGGPLLRSLTELLGCREKCRGDLEQLIFTSIGDEISRSRALGQTSFSLPVATSMKWYGRTFHWHRIVDEDPVDLTYAFKRELFDNRAYLYLTDEGEWAPKGRRTPNANRRYMEVRSRFRSGVPVPYWRAMWGALPDNEEWKDNMLKRALQDYRRGGTVSLIRAFLMARCEALRWLEERLTSKNRKLEKPMVPVLELADMERYFADRYDLVRACQDFLRLDHHRDKSEWLADLARSPAARVAEGTCIPLRNVNFSKEGGRATFHADIDLDRFGISVRSFLLMCGLDGGMMRLSPYDGSVDRGPTAPQALYGGATVTVPAPDIAHGVLAGDVIPFFDKGRGSDYILGSSAPKEGVMPFALAGEPKSAFVRHKVDRWLEENRHAPSVSWFDPTAPAVPVRAPPAKEMLETYHRVLGDLRLRQNPLDDVQVQACLEGLCSTVQLMLGPPGTGKTNTASAAIMLRLAARPGHKLFLLSATTHTAVDELFGRLREAVPEFRKVADAAGIANDPVRVLNIRREPTGDDEITSDNVSGIKECLKDGNVVVCGTVNDLLKLGGNFDRYRWPRESDRADGLVVDEASMMVFPEFLALSTLVARDGEIMLAGDHMQLSPITAHDWDGETREQVVRMSPHESAYNAMRRLAEACPEGAIRQSALSITYRLTPELTHLISSVYLREGVKLVSSKGTATKRGTLKALGDIWREPGVYLAVHGETSSRKSNPFEADLIRDIIMSRGVGEADVPPGTISVITPHRAQRGLLRETLSDLEYHIKLIDTVERLQGGECETIIVSGTQSDASAISGNAEFILDLNRTNVIFSRAQARLVVVCSKNLLDSMPADFDDYSSSMLWKHLRTVCDRTMLRLDGYRHAVEVRVPGRFWSGDGE